MRSRAHVCSVRIASHSFAFPSGAHINSLEQYQAMYKRSLDDSDAFWREQALATLDWFAPFTNVQSGSFQKGDVAVSYTTH
jgi:acetyl-CoA synthetase